MDEAQSDSEREQISAAERLGYPFLLYRDQFGNQRVQSLEDTWERLTVGRGPGNDLALAWDKDVSRLHAELVRLGEDWVLVDDGLSSNGTFVNDERIEGRRRLIDGDELRFGSTQMRFQAPLQGGDRTQIFQAPTE